MVIFEGNLSSKEIELIKANMDLGNIVEEGVLVFDNIAYIVLEQGEDYVVTKIDNVID